MSAPPICYVDAPGFGDTVTLTLSRNYTSPDGTTTVTGSASFTWTRSPMARRALHPKCPCTDYGSDPATGLPVLKAQFLAVACATGRMPGWLFFFGSQDSVPGAFTETYTPPPPLPGYTEPTGPTSTPLDAYIGLSAVTCHVAPGRPIISSALAGSFNPGGVLGINSGTGGGTVHSEDTPITVTLLRPQQAAVDKIPAVGPLYRVTIPDDCDLAGPTAEGGVISDFAYVVLNGQNYPPSDDNGFTGFDSLGLIPGAVFRSATSVDALLNYGDTLADGKIPGGYTGFAPQDALYISGSVNATLPITNPFPMQGQSFRHGPDDLGYSVTVQF